MPGGDRTGPEGMGPKTGRAAGFCSGYKVPGSMNPNFARTVGPGVEWQGGRGMVFGRGRGPGAGRGGGFGTGRGRGWRRRKLAPVAVGDENAPVEQTSVQDLKDRLHQLQKELTGIQQRISGLERT